MTIVGVQYRSRYTGEFSGRAYTYYAEIPLAVGDVVKCPTKAGETVGRVAEINLPQGIVDERLAPYMQTITEKAEEEDAE